MPTTKTISHIGDTKFELIKDTYDSFRFTVDDKSPAAPAPNSPKTVMYISSEPVGTAVPTPLSATGRVTMSNIRSEGAMSTSSADVDGDIGIGGKILIREGTGSGKATRAAIYAQKDTTGSNHKLIIDPYQEDAGAGTASANNGTVYIRGSLIVEGDKTILDTAEHITSENLIGINAVKSLAGDGSTITSGGLATTAGIHVYSGTLVPTQFLYDFDATRWLTGASTAALKDLETKKLYAVDIEVTGTISGNLTGAVSGNASTASTLATARTIGGVSFDGSGNIDFASTNLTARDVNAVTIGNIVPVELTVSGGRASTKTISANASAPLNADILAYYSGKTFAAGQCVVALTDGTNASVAMFSFSKCGGTLTLVLDQEVHSSVAALSVDYDSSGTIDLILGTASSATYCVKVLPVMTSDSIAGPF